MTVLLRRKSGHLTMLAIITIAGVLALGFGAGFFSAIFLHLPEEQEKEPITRCLEMSCSAPTASKSNRKTKIWEESLCKNKNECFQMARFCARYLFPEDLFMPGSKCTVIEKNVCRDSRKEYDTSKFSTDAIDRIAGRWRKQTVSK